MIDPLSVFGAIGTSAGLLGFLAITVENLAETGENARRCNSRLKVSHRSLRTCQLKIEIWCEECGEEAFDERMGRHVWGTLGWDEVEQNLRCIAEEERQLREALYGSAIVDLDKSRRQVLKQAMEGRSIPDVGSSGLFRRLAFALWRSNLLKKRVERLKGLVDDLSVLQRKYLLKPLGVTTGKTDRDSIVADSQLVERHIKLCAALSQAYRHLANQDRRWGLLLSPPAENDGFCLSDREIEIAFLYATAAYQTGLKAREVGMIYQFEQNGTSDISAQARRSRDEHAVQHKVVFQETFKTMFIVLSSHPLHHQRLFRKETVQDRARSALCIARWFALAWQTGWVGRLCNCGIMSAKFDDGRRIPALGSTFAHADSTCATAQVTPSRPYILLAVLLSELALAQPIVVNITTEAVDFHLTQTQDGGERLNVESLLQHIGRSTSPTYHKAVRYCFDCDRRQQQSRGSLDAGNSATWDCRLYIEYVLRPLQDHCTVLSNHVESQRRLYTQISSMTVS